MNNEKNTKITVFTDLNAWKESHKLVLLTYQLTKTFPKDEMYGLISQMRRAAISITSNIAEGFGRQTYPEKIQFYSIAKGSLSELQNQLIASRDTNLLNEDSFQNAFKQSITAHKLITGLIRRSREIHQS
ncbi:MAG: four helix bundle protein [bacterium]|nr:four helix bundle protein [bacterium]